MKPDRGFALALGTRDDLNHGFKRHFRAVMDLAVRSAHFQQRRIYEAARVYHDIRAFQKLRAAQSYEVGCAGTRADYMYHQSAPLIIIVVK